MADKLYIGTRRYSSWSMRGWLLVRLAGLDVQEILIPISGGNTAAIKQVSPNGLVPYLEHQGACIWESLAIAEYAAEHAAERAAKHAAEHAPTLWPHERTARAHARAIAAEMHAGFRALRQAMPMNLGRTFPGHGQTPESLADINRVDDIFTQTRAVYGASGPYLFGENFNAADAMFAPVAARFLTYQPALSNTAQAYVHAVRAHPLVTQWYNDAAIEPAAWRLEKYESPA